MIEELNKEELIDLREKIDLKLKDLEIKSYKPQENLFSLKVGDKIFGIRLLFGPHKLEEPNDLNGTVDIKDYCIVEEISIYNDSMRIKISHPKLGLGINTILYKKKYEHEHCLLSMDSMKSGYDAFYTLKPETWKEDLKKAHSKYLEIIEINYQEELKFYRKKLDLFLKS